MKSSIAAECARGNAEIPDLSEHVRGSFKVHAGLEFPKTTIFFFNPKPTFSASFEKQNQTNLEQSLYTQDRPLQPDHLSNYLRHYQHNILVPGALVN